MRLDLGQEKGRSGNIEGKKGKNGRVLRIMGRRGGEESCPKPWWQGENSPARGGRGENSLPVVAGGKLPARGVPDCREVRVLKNKSYGTYKTYSQRLEKKVEAVITFARSSK